ncbi:hypothetical protein KO353_13940 [Elioraea tepida]|uniref:Uncharacterized protein n=1 Tax=Elioraea tepida TaxID=2843330 RepID=A0A975U117_9PROT|nr:hypothetical protein [Elioraea tepida]QXM24332.1 hypothetical protein KO353_13940 [Elioraea tepida]
MTLAEEAPLARAAALVRSLRPDWRDAEAFYARRSEALGLLRRAAAAEVARLRRTMASARPKPRRRPAAPDPRQAALPLA